MVPFSMSFKTSTNQFTNIYKNDPCLAHVLERFGETEQTEFLGKHGIRCREQFQYVPPASQTRTSNAARAASLPPPQASLGGISGMS